MAQMTSSALSSTLFFAPHHEAYQSPLFDRISQRTSNSCVQIRAKKAETAILAVHFWFNRKRGTSAVEKNCGDLATNVDLALLPLIAKYR